MKFIVEYAKYSTSKNARSENYDNFSELELKDKIKYLRSTKEYKDLIKAGWVDVTDRLYKLHKNTRRDGGLPYMDFVGKKYSKENPFRIKISDHHVTQHSYDLEDYHGTDLNAVGAWGNVSFYLSAFRYIQNFFEADSKYLHSKKDYNRRIQNFSEIDKLYYVFAKEHSLFEDPQHPDNEYTSIDVENKLNQILKKNRISTYYEKSAHFLIEGKPNNNSNLLFELNKKKFYKDFNIDAESFSFTNQSISIDKKINTISNFSSYVKGIYIQEGAISTMIGILLKKKKYLFNSKYNRTIPYNLSNVLLVLKFLKNFGVKNGLDIKFKYLNIQKGTLNKFLENYEQHVVDYCNILLKKDPKRIESFNFLDVPKSFSKQFAPYYLANRINLFDS